MVERITLGQLLAVADMHFEAAERVRRPGTDRQGVVHELGRIFSVVARFLAWPAEEGQVEVIAGTRGSRADRAAAGLQEAMRQASARIEAARGGLGRPGERSDPVAGQLAATADALNAGCDLLGTHFRTRPDLVSEARSNWALLIASEPVTAALRAEMARWAARAAAWVEWLTSQAPDYARSELTAARHWLTAADALIAPTGKAAAEVAIGDHLLRDVPLASPPDRRVPTGSESLAELCAGITISADRLRAIIPVLSRQDYSVASVTGPSWFHAARAGAVVSDLAIWELGTLADQAAHISGLGADDRCLQDAADAFAGPRAAWQMASQVWRYVTTGPQLSTSAVTVELDDLVLRMGRLASGNPRWTPARKDSAPARDPASLVSGPEELAKVLAAIHHAADALAWMASADLEMTTAFGKRGHLYMSNRFLESPNASMTAYIGLPDDRLLMLQDAYRNVVSASQRGVRTLDDIAIAASGSSKTIGYARRLLTTEVDPVAPGTDSGQPDAEAIAQWFTKFTRPCRSEPIRRGEINALAVIHAYRSDGQTLDQCAERFGVSPTTIATILERHGVPRYPTARTSSAPMTGPVTESSEASRASLAETSPAIARPERGFMERRLLNAGIADINLLARAAAFDKASDVLLAEAIMAIDLKPQNSQLHDPADIDGVPVAEAGAVRSPRPGRMNSAKLAARDRAGRSESPRNLPEAATSAGPRPAAKTSRRPGPRSTSDGHPSRTTLSGTSHHGSRESSSQDCS
jgi:hypothetical protein